MKTDNIEPQDDRALMLETSAEDLKAQFPYMEKIVRISKLINMWPNINNKNCFFYHMIIWAIIINNVLFILTFCIQIKNEFNNMDSITALIDFVTVFISGTFRYIYVYVRGHRYVCLVSMIHNNFIHFSFFPDTNKTCLNKYYKLANRLILIYGAFTFFWILQICSIPLISYVWETSHLSLDSNQTELEHIPYPVAMKVYAPFDYYKQPENALFYIYQFVGFMMYGFIYIVVDSFWYMVIFLTIGQLVLIEESLRSIAEYLKRKESAQEIQLWEVVQTKKVKAGLKTCIKHHQFIREFIFFIENLNNPNVLIDSLHAAISIGFILLDATIALNTRDIKKIIYSVQYLATSIIHMFLFDWLATNLTEKEEKLAEAAYEIQWYKCPSLKIELILLIIQSRRPCRLTGGKMYQLSLSFFTSMLRAVFSYFTFLFQLRNGKPNSIG